MRRETRRLPRRRTVMITVRAAGAEARQLTLR